MTKAGNHCISVREAGAALVAAGVPTYMLIRCAPCREYIPPYANSTGAFCGHLYSVVIWRGNVSFVGDSCLGKNPPLQYREWDLDNGLRSTAWSDGVQAGERVRAALGSYDQLRCATV